MPMTPEIQETLTVLSRMPGRIARLARGRTDSELHRKPAPDAWSAQEIMAHLRACAEVWSRSIERMLAEDHPTIRYVSPRGWIRKTNYLEQSFGDSLRELTRARRALVAALGALDEEGWSRGATFTGTTLGRDATVLIYAKRIAGHEVGHLDQIRRALNPG
jgi:hypothetical protein